MPEGHLSHDEFFNKLGELFTSRKGKDHGSVYLTQKRQDPLADISATLAAEGNSDATPPSTYPVLVRATNGKAGEARKAGRRVKLATVVDSNALDAFYARYAEICKAGMMALKPRDRSKRKTKAKKKKGATA
ncbi:hypothetical protein M406DRAFT_51523 [Cryphonectria parasitica EP155]|uniref:Signal recognition particle subunit SRP14 n=1 Tax=Cryphonectria parasitica (strain ATCC 38755 / EP155) TaxID=660469 RepID=A0A9P4XZI7_CRYP1|nr:uncharacterized protein M406DRAFT_51523 [Cryphonectria parasitica EP155]KAF3763748.1 hypothetical protein M406DRAFT_51523 [Cryphonectria parasitica EP155]